jgi:polyphosphate kinase 2 (PPK2 family)
MFENLTNLNLVERNISLLFILVFVESHCSAIGDLLGVFARINYVTSLIVENEFLSRIVNFERKRKFFRLFSFDNVEVNDGFDIFRFFFLVDIKSNDRRFHTFGVFE